MKSQAKRGGNQNINEVQSNIIHNENIGKEMKYFDKNRSEHYQLNPNNGFLFINY